MHDCHDPECSRDESHDCHEDWCPDDDDVDAPIHPNEIPE